MATHKLKINIGTDTSPNFVSVEVQKANSTNGIIFKVENGKLMYSANNGSTWINN